MARSPEKEVRYIAAGYAIYALMFFGGGVFMLTIVGWHGYSQFFKDLEIIGGTLLLMLGGGVINLLMAFGSLRVFLYKRWKRNAILFGAVGIATILVLSNLIGLIAWIQGASPKELGYIQIISPLVIAVGYVLLAASLVRTVLISNNALQPTQTTRG